MLRQVPRPKTLAALGAGLEHLWAAAGKDAPGFVIASPDLGEQKLLRHSLEPFADCVVIGHKFLCRVTYRPRGTTLRRTAYPELGAAEISSLAMVHG
jgi:hypothetical protein